MSTLETNRFFKQLDYLVIEDLRTFDHFIKNPIVNGSVQPLLEIKELKKGEPVYYLKRKVYTGDLYVMVQTEVVSCNSKEVHFESGFKASCRDGVLKDVILVSEISKNKLEKLTKLILKYSRTVRVLNDFVTVKDYIDIAKLEEILVVARLLKRSLETLPNMPAKIVGGKKR